MDQPEGADRQMMKALLLQNWDMARYIRLGLAVIFLITGIRSGETVALVAAAFLGAQAVFNVGCCGSSCSAPTRTTASRTTDVTYEEIK